MLIFHAFLQEHHDFEGLPWSNWTIVGLISAVPTHSQPSARCPQALKWQSHNHKSTAVLKPWESWQRQNPSPGAPQEARGPPGPSASAPTIGPFSLSLSSACGQF